MYVILFLYPKSMLKLLPMKFDYVSYGEKLTEAMALAHGKTQLKQVELLKKTNSFLL